MAMGYIAIRLRTRLCSDGHDLITQIGLSAGEASQSEIDSPQHSVAPGLRSLEKGASFEGGEGKSP